MLAPAAELAVAKAFGVYEPLPKASSLLENVVEDKTPGIEIIIEQTALMAPPVAELTQRPVERETDCWTAQRMLSAPKIVCEPVDWKQWKVADLRKVSIVGACGVCTRPIGSRRNLSKADLIAQYKQQLKRMTKAPPKDSVVTEVVTEVVAYG